WTQRAGGQCFLPAVSPHLYIDVLRARSSRFLVARTQRYGSAFAVTLDLNSPVGALSALAAYSIDGAEYPGAPVADRILRARPRLDTSCPLLLRFSVTHCCEE